MSSDEMMSEFLKRRNKRDVDEDEDEDENEAERVLPNHFLLKSNHNNSNYLRYIHDDDMFEGFLQFDEVSFSNPYSKFKAEVSTKWKGFVHIKSSYNNKYWVLPSSGSGFIFANSKETEEDPSKWSSTLFEPIFDRDHQAYRLRHVYLDLDLFLSDLDDDFPYINCLIAKADKQQRPSYYGEKAFTTFVDLDSIFIFPKLVAFKGDNDKFLKLFDGHYLQFSGSEIKDPLAAHEVIQTNDGSVRIKNADTDKFWIRSTNWIHIKSVSNLDDDPDALFWPFKIDNKTVALRNMGNNQFCKRLSYDGKEDYINAQTSTIDRESRMEVLDIVVARAINNIDYRTNDARIYGQRVVSMATGDAVNKTTETDTVTFKFTYEEKKKMNWSNSLSIKIGLKIEVSGGIPIIQNAKVQNSFEIEGNYTWGETHKEKNLLEYVETVTVPPMSRVKIKAVINEGSCDVPFSYDQTDTLRDGTQIHHRYDDGVFTGVNSSDYSFTIEKVPL